MFPFRRGVSSQLPILLIRLSLFVKANARSEAVPQQEQARTALLFRRRTILAAEVRTGGVCDCPTPSTAKVVGKCRHIGDVA